jgi:O-antigen/teichoic acid export membrane protein
MKSRTGKTAVNSAVGIICTVVNSLLSFALRAVFIRLLGLEYAGINTLFADILNILNLADLGFNNAILFRLYRTISNGDDEQTEMYITLYKKFCYAVGTIVGAAGLCFIPFLGNLISESPTFKEPLWSLYIIILFNSVLNHIVNYKTILFIAKQDRYITTLIQYACIMLRHILQIVSLIIFKNIYLFLLISVVTTLIQGFVNGAISKKKYHLSWRSKKKVDKEEIKTITKDVGSLSVYKLCRTLDATIDTFLISKFVDVSTTAIYGSTAMILNALTELLGVFNDGMIASIGDLNAEGNAEHLENVFYKSIHFTYLIYGICAATLVPFLSAFCDWWIGYTLEPLAIYIMLLNFIMYGFGMNVATFRNSMGIFRKGFTRPAFTAAFNLIFSTILAMRFGLIGTLFGTLIARTLTLVWYDPWLVLHVGMKKSPKRYYFRYFAYLLFAFIASVILLKISALLPSATGLFSLVWHGILYFVVAAAVIVLFGFVVPEQKEILKLFFDMLKGMLSKVRGGQK